MRALVRTRFGVRAWRLAGALCLAAATLGSSGVSYAAPTAEETAALNKAREQFRQAISMEAAGDWAGALSLLREVAAVKMTPQVRYNMALCEEHLGRLVSALGEYQLAAADAQDAGAQDVLDVVGPRLESLKARIPKITVNRGPNAAMAAVSLDGVALGGAMVGKEMPINPGPHQLEAKASGFKPFKSSFEIAEKETRTIEIVLEPAPAAAEPTATPTGPAPSVDKGTPAKTNLLPFIVGGAGVASLVASGIFYGLRSGTTSDLDDACGPNRDRCPANMQDTFDKGKTYNTLTNVTLGLGVVGVAAGAVLYFTGKPKSSTSTSVGIAPAPMGATVVGRF